jgi:adenylate kinase family enzyme
MPAKRPVLLISGPPGAGKTTLAKALVKAARAPVIHIEGDAFNAFLPTNVKMPMMRRLRLSAMQAMMAAARPFSRAGQDTIVDFSIGPWFLPAVMPFLRDTPLDCVILLPPKETCAARVAVRKEGRMPDYALYADMYDAFTAAKDFEDHMITGALDTAALVRHIRLGLGKGRFRVAKKGRP